MTISRPPRDGALATAAAVAPDDAARVLNRALVGWCLRLAGLAAPLLRGRFETLPLFG